MRQFKYWLKLDSQFIFKNHSESIKSNPEFAEWAILYNKLILLNLTREKENIFINFVPFSAKKIAKEIQADVEVVKEAIKYFCNYGFMSICEINELFKDEIVFDMENFHGEYQNVYLDKNDYNKFLSICLDKKICDEIIEDLSEAIELKKYDLYDERRPHAHLVVLKRFYKYKIENMRKPKNDSLTREWISSTVDQLEEKKQS